MIEVKHLTKQYGSHTAVNDISFTVHDGEILGLLGPNGAGKSTTMNMLTGYISSTSGEALINGVDILEEPLKAKAQIGYLPELPPLYQDMTVMGYLNFVYDLKKCRLPRKAHLAEVCSLCKIEEFSGRIIKRLSKGQRQRVGMAQALIGNPEVLILDEPTVGLDPKQVIEIRNLVKQLGKKHTVILSTHILSEVQAVCDHIVIINHGEIVADDTLANLSRNTASAWLKVHIRGEQSEVVAALSKLKGELLRVRRGPEQEPGVFAYDLEQFPGVDVRSRLNELAKENGWEIYRLERDEMTLEDIFLRITMGEQVKHESRAAKNPAAKLRSESPAEKPAQTAQTEPEQTEKTEPAETAEQTKGEQA